MRPPPLYGLTWDGELAPRVAAWARHLRPAVPCKAHRSDGQPRWNFAMHGTVACHAHGGEAPQVQRAARYWLAEVGTEVRAARALRRLRIRCLS